MSLFPVSYSLLSKQAVGLHIQHHYEIGSVVKIQYFLRGMNDTYEVETDVDKYIFRIYRADRRSRSDIEFELKLAAELKNRISELEIKGLDWGVCHGDLHGNTNVAFAEYGKLTHYDFYAVMVGELTILPSLDWPERYIAGMTRRKWKDYGTPF